MRIILPAYLPPELMQWQDVGFVTNGKATSSNPATSLHKGQGSFAGVAWGSGTLKPQLHGVSGKLFWVCIAKWSSAMIGFKLMALWSLWSL